MCGLAPLAGNCRSPRSEHQKCGGPTFWQTQLPEPELWRARTMRPFAWCLFVGISCLVKGAETNRDAYPLGVSAASLFDSAVCQRAIERSVGVRSTSPWTHQQTLQLHMDGIYSVYVRNQKAGSAMLWQNLEKIVSQPVVRMQRLRYSQL